ncbi:hypothetical protein QYF36_009075 [Acer negundo]|nr:hypothetical protein QYF36_009075 [Acer negundo]
MKLNFCSAEPTMEQINKSAKASALLRGSLFAVAAGLIPTVLESDVKSVVDLVNWGVSSVADIGVIIDDILAII